MRHALLAAGVAGLLMVGATGPAASPSSFGQARVVSAAAGAPEVGQCWNQADLEGWVIEAAPVRCLERHTAQTIWVGALPDSVTTSPFVALDSLEDKYRGADGAVDWAAMSPADAEAYGAAQSTFDDASVRCEKELVTTIGAELRDGGTLSTLMVTDLTGPTSAQWAAGDRWVRCNAAADFWAVDAVDTQGRRALRAESSALMPLPADVAGLMRRAEGLPFHVCWKPVGGKALRAACGTAKAKGMWLTVSSDIPQREGMTWVNRQRAAQVAGRSCRALAESVTGPGPSVPRWWGVHARPDGGLTVGYTRATWGTDWAWFACAVPQDRYRHPR